MTDQVMALAEKLMKTGMGKAEARREAIALVRWQRGPKK